VNLGTGGEDGAKANLGAKKRREKEPSSKKKKELAALIKNQVIPAPAQIGEELKC